MGPRSGEDQDLSSAAKSDLGLDGLAARCEEVATPFRHVVSGSLALRPRWGHSPRNQRPGHGGAKPPLHIGRPSRYEADLVVRAEQGKYQNAFPNLFDYSYLRAYVGRH